MARGGQLKFVSSKDLFLVSWFSPIIKDDQNAESFQVLFASGMVGAKPNDVTCCLKKQKHQH